MKNPAYYLEQKEFDKIYNYVEETYNSCVLLAYFCNAHPEIEEIGNITPLVNLVRQKLDLLYADLIDMEEDASSK